MGRELTKQQIDMLVEWATTDRTCPYCLKSLGKPIEVDPMDVFSKHMAASPECVYRLAEKAMKMPRRSERE